MTGNGKLERLETGTPIPFGGDRVAYVSPGLAQAFQPGDRLIVLQTTGDLLHVPHAAYQTAASAVNRAVEAFGTTWSFLDLTPFGRQEVWEDSPEGWPQTPPYQWWRRHDEYGDSSR